MTEKIKAEPLTKEMLIEIEEGGLVVCPPPMSLPLRILLAPLGLICNIMAYIGTAYLDILDKLNIKKKKKKKFINK